MFARREVSLFSGEIPRGDQWVVPHRIQGDVLGLLVELRNRGSGVGM
jgi:hypothetical protein